MKFLRSRPTRVATCLAITAWCVLFVATHFPGTPAMAGFRGLDKLCHLAGFAVLSMLCCWAVRSRRRLTLPLYAGLVAALACYAAVDELLQIPIPGRIADPFDWMADVAGTVIGAVGFALILAASRSIRKKAWPMVRCEATGKS